MTVTAVTFAAKTTLKIDKMSLDEIWLWLRLNLKRIVITNQSEIDRIKR